MRKLIDIKNDLTTGDYKTIANMSKKSYETVRKVLNGKRNNVTVLKAAERLIETRKELIEKTLEIDNKEL